MSISFRRTILTAALFLGIAWNCLCLVGVFPPAKWGFSLALVGAASLLVLLPLLFPGKGRDAQPSKQYAQLEKREKILAGVTLALCSAWAVTVLACLVYPL